MRTTPLIALGTLALAAACSGNVDSGGASAGAPSGSYYPGVAPGGSAASSPFGSAATPTGSVLPGGVAAVPGTSAVPGSAATSVPGTTGTSQATPSATAPGATPAVADGPVDIKTDPSLGDPLPPESAGPLVVRRLSPREYSNTLRDLLGDTTDPGSQLPDEADLTSGFPVTESASTVSVQVFLDTAERLADEGAAPVPCSAATGEDACATQFIQDFGRKAFRRPVKQTELDNLLTLFGKARELGFEFEPALQQVASAMLQSSGFLYVWDIGDDKPALENGLLPLTQYQIASRLSYLIWGSLPDDELAAAADAGELATPDQIGAQAERLLGNSDRARDTLLEFHLRWLHLENISDLIKDPTLYPNFNDDVRSSLLPELQDFVASVILDGPGTSRALFTDTHTYANSSLGTIYGTSVSGDQLSLVTLDPTQRSGLLTQLAFLASNANTTGSNPPRRGKVVWQSVLCGTVPSPPANVPPVDPPSENLTTRQRFEAHAENACATACHGLIDPVGFAFENYDGVGAYQSEENGMPVDASGTMKTPAGGTITFNNAVELMAAFSDSYEVDRCLARNWFQFMLNREVVPADEGSLEAAYREAGAGPDTDFSIRDFIVDMVETKAFRYRSPSEGEPL